MNLDVCLLKNGVKKSSLSIPLSDPLNPNLPVITKQIGTFMGCANVEQFGIGGLIFEMIVGVSGCERGCPSTAMSVVRKGYPGFTLSYIEGGIMTAEAGLIAGQKLCIKFFPDFG